MIKYLYIDDETNDTINSFTSGLKDENLIIEYKHVDEINPKDFFINNLKNYDGLLLDLRTDEFSKNSNFTGSVWGQHVRDLSTDSKLNVKDVPIVLFSTDDKLRATYFKDLTSNNIFDRFLTKGNSPDNAKIKLISLANGYQEISKEKNFNKLLKIDTVNLDPRIFSRFEGGEDIPTHEYAQMILKDLIYAKGVLINEKYLASRLGIDKDISADWNKIKEIFDCVKYKGVFSDGWDRWWMFGVDKLFNNISGTFLTYLDAKERVAIIKEKLDLEELSFPEPIDKNESYDYWTVCKALKKPLDPHEAFKVYTRSEPKPWQEYEYISLSAWLEKSPIIEEKNISIHPMDKEKLYAKLEKYNG
jgi:hypothetical protein